MKKSSGSATVSLGLVGAGAIARSYVAAFEGCADVRLSGVVDAEIDRARALAEPLGIPAFDSLDDMLSVVGCDGVIISAPPKFHMELAIDALYAGQHVLCEKPLTIGSFAAERMYDAADAAGRILTMASKFRFVDDIITARRMLEDGVLGRLVRVENAFVSPVDMTQRWNSRVELSGGGVLIDNGTHSVDIMRFLLGPLTSVYAVDTSADTRYEACDDTASLFVRNAEGAVGTIQLSWVFANHSPWFLRLYGTKATVDIGWKSSQIMRPGAEPDVFGRGYDKQAAFVAQLENFAGAIRGDNAPEIGREDAIASVATIDAAYDSLRRNVWLPVGRARLSGRTVPTVFGELVAQR